MATKIKSKLLWFWQRDILDKLFILCGGKFYLDWVLVTNPQSKNKVFRYIFCFAKGHMVKNSNCSERLNFAYFVSVAHICIAVVYFRYLNFSFMNIMGNILINFYPIIVNIYIGFRCLKILKWQKQKLNG